VVSGRPQRNLEPVDQLYFDDKTWAIRYLVLETGGGLGGRRVLISPISAIQRGR
jgi:hypothetical protein